MTLSITAIIRPSGTSKIRVPRPQSPRNFSSVDEFAAEVAEAARCDVPVIEGTLADAPANGYLLAFPPIDFDAHAALASRIVVMQANAEDIYQHLERYGLVAAIGDNRYFRWKHRREEEVGSGLIGRKDLADAIHAADARVYFTEHYTTLQSAHYPSIPRLLAAYLQAHAARQ